MTDETTTPFSESTRQVDLEEEMKRSYLDYAMSVIVGRALPDVRDGLKPVHRRVLYGMWESGNTSNKAYKKSARIVGDVMGKYHPHGDSAIYDTVARLAQDFSMRYMLVDGQGNFGSIDGDSPAAMRYTEVRMTKLSEEMLRDDIDKETVPFIENYDGSESEPSVLPAKIPNLLINGASGIAVGMATNIPPHNLTEVIDALILYIGNPDATLDELMEVLPGPDFPTGGAIHGLKGIRDAYQTGRGTIHVRAKAEVVEAGNDRQTIIVSEIPFQVNKTRLIERIAELVREKRVEGISDLRDESDRDGIRLVIELKRGEIGEVILNALYKLTPMQTSFGMNMLAIVDYQPRVLRLQDFLDYFLNHRKTVVVRRTRFDLRKAEDRAHILEGILKALDHLDEVIATIRASQTAADARANLMERFEFSEVQAQAILDMRLQRLTGMERDKVVEEHTQLLATIERLRAILGSDALVLEEILGELREIRDTYGDERRTLLLQATGDISIEDMIADEDMVITVTNTGYVKRSPLSLYRAQNRGGKGRMGMQTKDGDWVEQLYVASAHSYILAFTSKGHVYWLKVHQIPELGPAAKGKAIVNLLDLSSDEKIVSTIALKDFAEGKYLFFATRKGTIKKTELEAYSRPRAAGIIGLRVDDDDSLLDVRITDGKTDIFLATQQGRSIRFPESDVRPMGRATRGVRGISLRDDDQVVSLSSLSSDGEILTLAQNGYGKRTRVDEYRVQGRGGKGIINLKVSKKTGLVVAARQVEPDDGLMLISQQGKLIRVAVDGVSVIGRSTQGVRVMHLEDGDCLVAVAKVHDDEDAAEQEHDDSGSTEAQGDDSDSNGADEESLN